MLLQRSIQMIENDTRLNLDCALNGVDLQHIADVFGVVNDQACAGGLTTLTGTAAARNNGHTKIAADGHGNGHLIRRTRHKHTHRFDLIDRGIGGVTTAVSRAKQDLALRF